MSTQRIVAIDRGGWVKTARRRAVRSAVAALVATQLVACAADSAKKAPLARVEQTPGSPMVLSSTPEADTVAYQRAERKLSAADWAQLEKLGPRPMWERFQSRSRQQAQTATPEASHQPVKHAPATAPTTAPASPIDESSLPAEISELPDGKLRIIWALLSYVGSQITSATDGGTTRRNINVAPGDLAPLVAAITPYFGAGGAVLPLPRENKVIITCDRASKGSILGLLDQLDVPPRQVQITAKVFEVSRDFDFQQGARAVIKRLASDNSQTAISTFDTQRFLDSANKDSFQGSVLQLLQTFKSAGISIDATFELLAEEGLINVVSSPRMTVAEGQTGYMLAGQELPIQSSTITGGVSQTTTSYKPVGVQLYITPQVISDQRIKLHTISIVSSVSGFSPLPVMVGGHAMSDSLVNPIIDSREAETAVTIDDRCTLVISGLRMVRTTTRENKVPGLGDVPLLGWLFKNHRSQEVVTDLYFFVTPTLL